jgi:hypothetical protein
MSISLESVPLKYRSNSDYLASLPPWRRLLARLNWHPVRDIEIETWRIRIEKERLRSEAEQIRKETELLRKENKQREQEWNRWQQLDAQIEALFSSDASCSSQAPTTDDASMPS